MNAGNFSLLQGSEYLETNKSKPSSIFGSKKQINRQVEGFSTNSDNVDPDEIKNINDNFNKALSDYGISHKQLMSEANSFINNRTSTDSNIYKRKTIRMKNGQLGFITDKNVFKHIKSDVMLNTFGPEGGCPREIENVEFTSEKYLDIGKKLGTNPDFIVGKPMSENDVCPPTEINMQVHGHYTTDGLAHKWVGCYNQTGDFFDEQKDLTGEYEYNTIRKCAIRTADIGASTFYIGHEPTNKYTCFVSKPGLTTENIKSGMDPGVVKKISSVIHSSTIPASYSNPAFGIMNNGQIALGSIKSLRRNNFGLSVENQIVWEKHSGFAECDPVYGSKINVLDAEYGANCNGMTRR